MADATLMVRQEGSVTGAPLCTADSLRLLERSHSAMWLYGCTQQRIVWANEGGLEIWQAEDQHELRGRSVAPRSRGVAQRIANLRQSLATRARIEDSWTIYPHSVPRRVRLSVSLVRLETGEDGLLFEVLSAGNGIAPAGELHKMDVRAIEAINQASLMISLMTPVGSWLMHNPAAEALLRRMARPHLAEIDNFVTLFADPAAAEALRDRALAHGWARASLRLGSRIPRFHDVTLRRVQDPATGAPALMMSQLDVTRSKVLERKLAKALAAERAMSETQRHFLSLTSHEFRTPLAIIAGAVRRLRSLARSDPEAGERLETISAAVSRMQDGVEKTLWGCRIDAGCVEYSPATIELAPVIARAVAVQREMHPQRRIALDIGRLPPVTCDSTLVEQAIDNLLSNAIKYSPDGEPIELTATSDGRTVCVAVRDHGIGVPERDQARLFSRFYRASNAQGMKGTGIGLMVVRHVMDLHGGTVEFNSCEAVGSEVVVHFPAAA